ncbi:MAG: AAA family ATPase [Deltaproteobacteria bacterium]|nr:AAA family ATPase [Deltaproteobacteria bacterium]
MVYEKFFYLKENPFSITPDAKFLYLSKKHQEALDLLLFGISERKGFLLLSGEVGTGKTTICRALLDKLNSKVKSALILNPLLSDLELIGAVNEDFGLKANRSSLKEQLDILNSFLLKRAEDGGNAVVIIDEAQNLSTKTLEMIRLLSNLETEKMKLLQIVLVGQPELREKLKLPELRQLNQRVVVRCHLKPLHFEETKAYIFKRLTIAGGKGNIRFTSTALKSIYDASSGIPRLINIVCDRALTAAFVAGKRVIDDEIEKKAVEELDMDGTLRKDVEIPYKKSGMKGRKSRAGQVMYLAVSAVSIAAIFAVWWNGKKQEAVVAITPIIKSAAEPVNLSSPPVSKIADQSLSSQKDVNSPGTLHTERDKKADQAGGLNAKALNEVKGDKEVSRPQADIKSEKATQVVSSPEYNLESNKARAMQTEENTVQPPVKGQVTFKGLLVLVNGVEHTISNSETLEVMKGDKLKIVDATVEGAAGKDVSVNLLGFVPKGPVNKGEDRGYLIDTAKDLRVKYSIKGQGVQYPIVVKFGDNKIGEVFIKIVSR